MRRAGYIAITGFIILAAAWQARAASYDWPEQFAAPVSDGEADSSTLQVRTVQMIYEKTFRSRDQLAYQKHDSVSSLVQNASYELSHEFVYGEQNHYVDLAGHWSRGNFLRKGLTLGLEWTPWMVLYRKGPGALQVTADAGPSLSFPVFGVPVRLQGGLSGRMWNDSVPEAVTETRLADMHGTPGYYTGFDFGGGGASIGRLPLFVSGRAFWRDVEQADFGIALISALYQGGIPSGDSLIGYYADTIGTGRNSSLREGADGRQKYLNSARRTERSMHGSVGIKAATRLHFVPAFIYSYANNSLVNIESPLNDRKHSGHAFTVQLSSDSSLFFQYAGGLAIRMEKEDKVFTEEPGHTVAPGGENKAVLLANLGDYNESNAVTDHSVTVPLPWGMDISYRFNMERETQLFPQWYDSASDTTRSPHDYDRLKQNHKIGFGFLETQRWTGSLEYLYNKQVVSYRRAEKSAGNGTDHYYTIGIALSYAHDTGLVLEERLSAMVNTEEYRYPYMHYDPYRRPGYSRKALSNLSVRWNAMPWLALNSLWNISYGDDGYWYGRQYFPPDTADGAAPRQVDYYAIDSKTLEHSLFLSSKIRFHGFGFVEIGGRIKDIYERVFRLSSKAYEVNQADKGYIIEPLFGAGCDDPGWLSVELTIKCRIYIKPGLDIDVPSEWDARLGVSATF